MISFTDTHVHLYLDEFDRDRDQVIRRAADAGVRHLFLPNIDASTIRHLVSVCSAYPAHCFGMMGLHPTSVKHNYREQMGAIEMELRQNRERYVAIGEIGIDLYWDKTHAREQEEVFIMQLGLAEELDLPVVIHTRNSMDIALEICQGSLKSPQGDLFPPLRGRARDGYAGVFHCFSGNVRQAERAVEMGYLLGIGGAITFKNSGLQQVVKAMSLECLLLETDAPFLAPVPYRGKRNESSYIPMIAGKVAELKGIPVEKVAEVTTEIALTLFGVNS